MTRAPPSPCDDAVCAFVEFQDANDPQPMLYAAGEFTKIVDPNDPNAAGPSYIARWNGQSWEEVGDPNDADRPHAAIYARAVNQEPNEPAPALYAGGGGGVHRWKNNTWSRLESPGPGAVQALAVFDDGSGDAL